MSHDHTHPDPRGTTSGRFRWALLAFLAIAGFFLFTEHRAHLFGVLPLLLLLLVCPLMHLFMHGGGGHRHSGGDKS